MRKVIVLLLIIISFSRSQAQDYQINFTGAGASTTVDSVKVENLTKCTRTTLAGTDILHLIDMTVGLNKDNNHMTIKLQIYPNPNTGDCLFNFEANDHSITTIELYDITGQSILYEQELLTNGYQSYSLSGMNCGVYFLKITSGDYSCTSKILSSNLSKTNIAIRHIDTKQSTNKKTPISNIKETISFKGGKSVVDMQYNVGDRLKLTGKSDTYCTVFILIPDSSQTITFDFVACTDADGNNYSVVQIGNQIWMAENLRYLPSVVGPNIGSSTTPYYYVYGYNSTSVSAAKATSNYTTYGVLYNWPAAMAGSVSSTANPSGVQGVCPLGWHLPSDAEWTQLTDYLGGASMAAGKLREKCATHWYSPNVGATDEIGYTALPAGRRGSGSWGFLDISYLGRWWSASEYNATDAWGRSVYYVSFTVNSGYGSKDLGHCVRCLKDF